ncbi:uncharacterized protein LY89DRAFT_122084 [Mollisia scopiformis]|uniref:RTA1-like protein n=1 Tax=Mollisia scopiformis TaxID=149040 RepID=A0A194X3M6_MOLSC|nr:uncharacterized protein LY89DRAFT_122084 [Mollisia scopiformis]KUJ14771.1 hypothetical protein LY89DRAFT_122084 [Mollisia scopiformis]
MGGENGQYVDGSLWYYAPSKAGPVVWAFFFLVSGILHTWQCVHYKCWRVSGLFPWAALIFVVGYILREVGAFNYSNIDIYISSQVFIYCAPPVYELQNYFILSRILYYVPYHSPIHPGRILTTFGGLSAVVEALNGNGAAYVANTSLPQSKQNIGKSLLKAALCLQLGVLACFVLLAAYFHLKCKRAGQLPLNLNAVLITLYCSSALIGARTIYRTYEYFSIASLNFKGNIDPGSLSPVIRYEWFFIVFEATLMIINSFLMNFHHPMRFLPRDNKIYLAEGGVTEIKGPGYQDNRNFIVTMFDPFDLVGMLRGRNMNQKFWETHDEGRRDDVATEVEKGHGVGNGVVGSTSTSR